MPTRHHKTALLGGFLLTSLAGCQTEGGFGATMADVRDTIGGAIGLEPSTQEAQSEVKEQIQEVATQQRDLHGRVQLAYNELDTLTRVPEDELEAQHVAYTQAIQSMREQVGVTTRLRGEAHSAADGYAADMTRTLTQKVSNPGLRNVAQRNLDLFKTSVTDALSQTGQYDVDLNPLLARFDNQVAPLKDGLTAASVGRVRGDLAQLKNEVDGVLSQLDQQVVQLDNLVSQVDVVDASLTPLGL